MLFLVKGLLEAAVEIVDGMTADSKGLADTLKVAIVALASLAEVARVLNETKAALAGAAFGPGCSYDVYGKEFKRESNRRMALAEGVLAIEPTEPEPEPHGCCIIC